MAINNIQYSDLDIKLSQQYVQIVLGMDSLYRSSSNKSEDSSLDSEGLVPINLTVETPNEYSDWHEVISDLAELQGNYVRLENGIRRNYLQQQVGSLICLARWCSGEEYPFREKVRGLLYVNENPITRDERLQMHEQLDKLLSGKGFKGSLHEKLAEWEEEQKVKPQDIETVLTRLLRKAKEQVAAKMFPEIENVEVTPKVLYGVPYSAYCDYVNQKMYINGDLKYTLPSLKHLVTHEAFPGHTTHMAIREKMFTAGNVPLDAALVITNTASSSIFEGIGDNGIHFIDWINSIDDEIYYIYQSIRSISGINAAHMIHAEQQSEMKVKDFLRDFAFGEENWVSSRMRFFNHSLRAPFIYGYWRGNEAVNEVYSRVSDDRKRNFYDFLYRNMLSADTIKHFV